MTITCPQCNFSRTVEPDKIPDRPVKVNCPKCGSSFSYAKPDVAGKQPVAAEPERITCPACGLAQPKSEDCSGCGINYEKYNARLASSVHTETGGQNNGQKAVLQRGRTVDQPAARPKAGFWLRVVATLIDSFLLCIVQFVLTLIITLVIGFMGIAAGENPGVSLVIWLFGTTISLGYAVFFTGYCGQTPGKMALRIKVICTDGSQLTYGRAAKREVLGKFVSSILLGIGYLMVAFDHQKQGLHDKIADTYVIKL